MFDFIFGEKKRVTRDEENYLFKVAVETLKQFGVKSNDEDVWDVVMLMSYLIVSGTV